MSGVIKFEVWGHRPVPYAWGPGGSRNGREFKAGIPNDPAETWKKLIRKKAEEAMRGRAMFLGPVVAEFRFYARAYGCRDGDPWTAGLTRNPQTGGYRKADRREPDTVNLTKLAEDALGGIVFPDDAIVCRHSAEKLYGPRDGVVVEVRSYAADRDYV